MKLERIFRFARFWLHFIEGWIVASTLLRGLGTERRKKYLHWWMKRLVRITGVRIRTAGNASFYADKLPPRTLLVANHISWLDGFLLHSLWPMRFVAKQELKRQPVAGSFLFRSGIILLLRRGNNKDAARVREVVSEALRANETIAVFPEGTTTDGTNVKPFHPALFQSAIDVGGQVLPVSIQYLDSDNNPSDAAVLLVGTSMLVSIWRVLSQRGLVAQITVLPLLQAEGSDRRELAVQARLAIMDGLQTSFHTKQVATSS